jgi:hypothetical protein
MEGYGRKGWVVFEREHEAAIFPIHDDQFVIATMLN